MFAFTWMRTRAAVTHTAYHAGERTRRAFTKGLASRTACFADFISANTRAASHVENSLGAFPSQGFQIAIPRDSVGGVMACGTLSRMQHR